MIDLELMKELSQPSPSKIILMVIDGLGGLPDPKSGKTEIETAKTTNLDQLAREGICGVIDPVSPGITPGSAPAHFALFGYDPVRYQVGRGVLEALGIDFDLKKDDVSARGNFCTIDRKGIITDRRAGRISTEKCTELCQLLNQIQVKGAELIVSPVKEHRFVLVLRGTGLRPELADTDPQMVGAAPKAVTALSPKAGETARIANEFITRARAVLANSHPANMVLLRGFSQYPHLPSMSEVYKLKPVAIAAYPMYRGLAKLVGMTILPTGVNIGDEFTTLERHYNDGYDFFFLHIKAADSAGEDGDFDRKVGVIEEVDSLLPRLRKLGPDVLVVTGDHSTPSLLKGHSWHPVPLVLHSQWCRPDRVAEFSETACAQGALGRFPSIDVMTMVMANALKLEKFGA